MYKIEDLIEKANQIHCNKYSYDESTYVKTTEKMRIICPVHGEFWQSLHQHINKKQGCPHCGKEVKKDRSGQISKKINPEEYFKKCRDKFGDKFIYSNDFTNMAGKIRIICPKHGEFIQNANSHLNSETGCPKCSWEKLSSESTSSTEEFITKAQKIHGNIYDYSKVNYKNVNEPICIICPKHGDFMQLPYNHLSGNGCPACGVEKTRENNLFEKSDFIKKANEIHKGKYDYSKTEYKCYTEKVCIICPEHGEFWQTPDNHLQGKGCRICGNTLSKAENEIYDFCCNILGKDKVIQNDRTILYPQELDIYIPSLKIGIEYNGLSWHSEEFGKEKNYHLKKLIKCNEKGVKLIQIFEDEYIYKKEIVLSKIKHLLKCEKLPKIGARKCEIKEINNNDAKVFLNENHIQGYSRSTIYLGAFFNKKIVAVMSFKEEKIGFWELTRFASDNHYLNSGIGGKLFSFFVKKYSPKEVKSFADRRWTISENNLYTKIGFEKKIYLAPDYRYIKNNGSPQRYHKFRFRKQILHKKYNLPLTMTENEMAKQLGFSKIWDCGLIKYIWKEKEGL